MNIFSLFLPGSPFKVPRLGFYLGRIQHGVPYFLPRRRVTSKELRTHKVPKPAKWLHFKGIWLGYKTKWDEWDYRFEWSPMLSIVFCHLQFVIRLSPEYPSHYWECWLTYRKVCGLYPELTMSGKLKEARRRMPQIWVDGKGVTTDYWELILKERFVK